MEEGDVLYLPPFYFHRVESYSNVQSSVIMAINIWIDSLDQILMKNIYSKNYYVPFTNKQFVLLPKYQEIISKEITNKQEQGLVIVNTYIKWVVKTIFGKESTLLSDLYKYRYFPIFKHLNLV